MINVTTIDNIVKEKSIDDRCLALWIDVEGFSRDVLLGAKYVLESQQCPLINIEVESNPYFSGQALATEINDVLSGFGLVPVLTDCESVDQFNVVYIREELLDKVSEDLRNSWIDLSRIKFSFFDWIYFAFIYKLKERLLTLLKRGAIRLFGNEVGHKMAAKFGSKKSSIVVTQTESDRSVGNSP